MKKVILVCNLGMSTSMMAQKIEENGQGEFQVYAYGETEYLMHIEGVDCILVGPQVRYLLNRIKNETNNQIPVDSIPPRAYGTMNGKMVIEQINEMLKQ